MYLMMQDIPVMKIDLDKNIYEVLREELMPIRLKDFYKLEIGVCRGKKNYDKRETIKKRDIERTIRKEY